MISRLTHSTITTWKSGAGGAVLRKGVEGLYTWKNILYGDGANDFEEVPDPAGGRYKGIA